MSEILLSVLVVVHNEEHRLASCLETLDFCDEIVVVLDRCTDGSEAIAKKFGAHTVKGAWEIEGTRRNVGIKKCRGKWVLEIDADEHVPKSLAEEILSEIKKYDSGFFDLKVRNFINGREITHGWSGTWGKTRTAALTARKDKVWTENDRLHPKVKVTGDYHGEFKTALLHYAAEDMSHLLRRFDTYTTLRALDLQDDPSKMSSLWRDTRRIFSRFFDAYIRLKGYREGGYGFINALLAGLYHIVAHLKATTPGAMKENKKN